MGVPEFLVGALVLLVVIALYLRRIARQQEEQNMLIVRLSWRLGSRLPTDEEIRTIYAQRDARETAEHLESVSARRTGRQQ